LRIQFVLAFNLQMIYFYYKLSIPTTVTPSDSKEDDKPTDFTSELKTAERTI
jgi:hypothetical protein